MAELSIVDSQPLPATGGLSIVDSQPLPHSLLGDVGDTIKQYWDKVNPVTQAQGVAAPFTQSPKKTVGDYSKQQQGLLDEASKSFKSGAYSEGVRHGLMYMLNGVPGFGAALDEAGNKAGKGDYKGAVADTGALATYLLEGKWLHGATDAATEPGAAGKAISAVTEPVKQAATTVKKVAKVAKDVVADPEVLRQTGGAVGGVAGGVVGHATGLPYAGYGGAYLGRKLGVAVTDKLLQRPDEVGNIKTPAPPEQEPYASPGGIPTGPDLSGGGGPAEILAAELARRRAAKANANVPTPPSAPTPPDEVNGVPVGAAEPLPVSPSRQLNAGPVVHAMPPAADTSGVIKGWQPTILENENAPVQQAPVVPQTPAILPEWEAAAKAMGAKDFASLPEGIKTAIRNAKIKPAGQPGVKYTPAPQAEVAPEANAGAQPEASVVAEAQSRRLEKDRQQFLQALKDERANQESAPEVAPGPAQPEPVSTPEPEVAPPAAPKPQEQPVPEAAAPIQPEVSPVKNPVSGQAHPIPKDFGANELSDMPVRSGHAQIRSSTVHSVGYDPETGHPEIHFKKPFPNGGLYRYPNLPQEELLRAVQEAPSFGAWTREVLRANPEWTKGYQKISTEENPPLLGGQQAAAPAQSPAENAPAIAAQSAENPIGKNPEGVPDNPHPKAVYTVPTSHLQVDAPRFQYKAGMGKGGAGDALRGVQKYDTQQGGVLSVWRDPANGKDYIVNGHHRLELAQRAGEPNVRVQYIDAPTAADARLKGAILNIGEGQGTAIDAAKVFRDGGIGPEELGKYGIALTAAKAKAGMALANLDPHLFSKVVNGEFPIERAQIIGEGVKGMEDQRALYDLIKKRESSGKSMTDGQISEMIRLQSEAPRVEESQESLFGTQEMSRSLLPEKAEVSSYVRQQLSEEKKLFKAVANGSAAEKLGAAGNVIKAEENAKVAITAAQAQVIYDKLSTSAGAINTALDEAAQAIAKGSNATNAKTIAYQKIKSELFKQAKSLAGEN